MAKLSRIEGIGPVLERRLKGAGIGSVETLLRACGSRKGRRAATAEAKIDEKRLLRFVQRADLMRIRGIGGGYSELLAAVGIDSVPALRKSNARRLTARMAESNAKKRLVKQLPAVETVEDWIAQSRRLRKAVTP